MHAKDVTTRVTIKDVAREAGVSTALVSVVLNAKRREDGSLDCDINRDTAARVLKIVEKLGYRRNKVAAGLRSGKSYTIGVITPDISNMAFAEIGRSIEDVARENDYTVMFGSSEENPARQEELVDAFIAAGVDGLIIIPCAGGETSVAKAVNQGVPVVLSNRDVPGLEGVGRVSIDHSWSIRKAVKHLYDNDYRRIELISERMSVSSVADRERGYTETIKELGLTPVIHAVNTETQREETVSAVKDAVGRGVDAIIAARIQLSFFCIEAIQEMGIQIPTDLALICADDSPVYHFYRPTITYISHSSFQIGEKSFNLLKDMMEGAAPYQVILEPELHIGGSSARIDNQ